MIYFDKETLNILKYIRRHKGVTEQVLKDRFERSEDDNISMLLIEFIKENYVLAKNESDEWVLHDELPYHSSYAFRYYITSKGNEMVEKYCFEFWRWVVPTLISIISLMVSIVTLLLSQYGTDVIKVLLVK